MNREKEVLQVKYNLLLDELESCDPIKCPEYFQHLLSLLDRLHYSLDERHSVETPASPTCNPEAPVVKFDPPAPEPEPEPDGIPAPVETEKTYTKEEVRAALAKSRKAGVNVTELLGEFGVSNFSGLPAAKYPEVMAKLGES